jgi:hypothetical protein
MQLKSTNAPIFLRQEIGDTLLYTALSGADFKAFTVVTVTPPVEEGDTSVEKIQPYRIGQITHHIPTLEWQTVYEYCTTQKVLREGDVVLNNKGQIVDLKKSNIHLYQVGSARQIEVFTGPYVKGTDLEAMLTWLESHTINNENPR